MQNHFEAPESVEARAIMQLVTQGQTTLEDARDLIGVPEQQEQVLRVFITGAGKAGKSIGSALAFRHRVMIEFEKLVDSLQADTRH
jgi:hypothetical protein